MSNIQKVFVVLVSIVLFLVLTIGVPLTALSQVVSNKQAVREILTSDSVYNSVKDLFSEDPVSNISPEGTAQPTTADPNQEAIQKVIDQFLTQDVYQDNINRLVTGFYAYMDGDAQDVHVEIKITDDPAGFQQFLVNSFVDGYAQLPTCNASALQGGEYDPLSADCQAPGVTVEDVRARVLNNKEFTDILNGKLLISSRDLPGATTDGNAQQFGHIDIQTLQNVRNTYQFLQSMKLVVIIATIVLLGLLAAIAHSKRVFKVWAIALLPPAVLLMITTLIAWLAQKSLVSSVSPASDGTIRNNFIQETLAAFVSLSNQTMLIYSGVLLLLGISSLVAWLIIGKNSTPGAAVRSPSPSVK